MEIGQELADARRKKGISLKKVEEATKIRQKFLEAMETNDFDSLPGSVYAKGFIRSYASFLGLDANGLVECYKEHFQPKQSLNIKEVPRPLVGHEGPAISRKLLIPIMVILIIFAITSFLGYLGSIEKVKPKKRSTFTVHRKKVKPKNPIVKAKPLPFELTLLAVRQNWIRIIVDGRPVYQGYIYRGQQIRWQGRQTIVVNTNHGNRLLAYINRKPAGLLSPNQEEAQRVFQKGHK